jgi:hypothetical protein
MPRVRVCDGRGPRRLGGCLVWPDQASHRCNDCGLEFRPEGRPVRVDELPHQDQDRHDHHCYEQDARHHQAFTAL